VHHSEPLPTLHRAVPQLPRPRLLRLPRQPRAGLRAGSGAASSRRGLPDGEFMPASASGSAAGAAADAAGAAAAGMGTQASQRAGAGAGRGGGGEAGPVWRSADVPRTGSGIHTLVTSNGSPYLNFQLRIMCAARLTSPPVWLRLGAHAAALPWTLSSCNASAAARWRTTRAMRAAAEPLPDRVCQQQRRPITAAGRVELCILLARKLKGGPSPWGALAALE